MQWNAIGKTAVTTTLFRTNSDAGNVVLAEDLDRQLEPNPGWFTAITNGRDKEQSIDISLSLQFVKNLR
nr:hypothetical protein Iba_chr11bCG17680 [Ipomoea batatas]